MSDVVWEDPPRISKWTAKLAPLMEHPGRWARISDKTGTAGNLRAGEVSGPPGTWEFKSASGKSYARYMGPDNA